MSDPSDFGDKSSFLALDTLTYLATAQAGPVLMELSTAQNNYMSDRAKGLPAKKYYDAVANETRARITALLGPDFQVAFVGNVSQAVSLLAAAVRFNPGDNVVLEDIEYPSAALPWFPMSERGVEIRLVKTSTWSHDVEALTNAIDEHTAVVCISHVSYLTGFRHNLALLRGRFRSQRTRLIVDASQSLGIVPFTGHVVDAVVSCSHKWLLGPHGVGIIGWNERLWPDVRPLALGWHSVEELALPLDGTYCLRQGHRRFEGGGLPYAELYGLNRALIYLSRLGDRKAEQYAHELGDFLLSGLEKFGVELITPRQRTFRAGNIAFRHDRASELQLELANRNIHVVGGHGRIRVSLHVFNDFRDVEKLLDELRHLGV